MAEEGKVSLLIIEFACQAFIGEYFHLFGDGAGEEDGDDEHEEENRQDENSYPLEGLKRYCFNFFHTLL